MASSMQPQRPHEAPQQIAGTAQQTFPERFFSLIFGYKQSAALKAAIELDLFTAIGEGNGTAEALALRLQASVRGVRILCDFFAVEGFLTKQDGRYALTPDCATFLDRRSGAYIGSAARFLANPMLMENFRDLAACVRQGGSVNPNNTVQPEHPVWAEFARSMAPLSAMAADGMAQLLGAHQQRKWKVLDIAASHGLFGITLARHNPNAEIVALDWKNVLPVARENAQKMGVAERYRTIEGSAFEVEFGSGYDIILVTNLLHHFDIASNESLLRKAHDALSKRGRVVVLEIAPDADRITPPAAAEFALTMLATTPQGDAYTVEEYEGMFANAGFGSVETHELPPFHRVLIANRG